MLWSLQSKSRIKTITKFRLLLRNNSQKSSKKNEAFFCFRRWYWHWKNIIHCLFILHRISNNNFVKIYIFSSEIKVYHPLYKFSTQIIPFQSLQLWRNQFGFVLLGEAKSIFKAPKNCQHILLTTAQEKLAKSWGILLQRNWSKM